MNELSPRRTPRSPIAPPKTPPQWKRPEEVMKKHKLRSGQQNLISRFNRSDNSNPNVGSSILLNATFQSTKRKNPFKKPSSPGPKKIREENEDEESNSLYRLLGLTDPQMNSSDFIDINEIIHKIKTQNDTKSLDDTQNLGSTSLPVDWTLRTKIRFMSLKPFPWTQTLKTCEEASGITGFVRCVDTLSGNESMDTTPNALFHQCCCYWQHPSLPWLRLFPRTRQVDDNKTQVSTNQPQIKEALHKDWTDSFRSLFQLVRTRHCPYFYIVGNLFTCMFRAAGVHGCNEINAMISPTTLGFRQLIKDDGIQFTMPLRRKDSGRRSTEIDGNNDELDEIDDEDEGQGETRQWLESLGIGQEEINRISSSQELMEINSKKKTDGDCESLIYVEGCEAQALYNFLINCKSITPTTGPLAGVPPTLVAPVAFVGGCLSSLKVRESVVREGNESYYSMEVKGPILPHAVLNLCHILQGYLDKYSVIFATIEPTKAFSKTIKAEVAQTKAESSSSNENKIKKPEPAFNQGSLSDCGLQQCVLSQICSYDIDVYDSIKYSDNLYSWS